MHTKLLIAFSVFFIGFFTSAQTVGEEEYNTTLIEVKNDIYMLQGQGGNIGLSFGNDGVFMIDDQFEKGIPTILEEIRKISEKPIKYLVNTHHHGDHTGGNALLKKEGTTIFSHDNVRNIMQENIKTSSEKIDSDILPIITFSEDMNFHFNGEKIMAFHVHNAHTNGDVMVYFTKSNVLHTGDTFFNGKYPFIDLDSGGSIKGSLDALEKILMIADKDTKIIPGHGNIATINEVMISRSMLLNLWKRITYHYMKQKTLEEVIAMKELTQKYDDLGFGKGFISTEKIISTIYKGVEKERGPIDNRSMEERLQDKLKESKGKKRDPLDEETKRKMMKERLKEENKNKG